MICDETDSASHIDVEVSTSGDMGYTYGSYELKGAKGGPSEVGNYLRVWKKQRNGKWKVVLDVMSAIE